MVCSDGRLDDQGVSLQMILLTRGMIPRPRLGANIDRDENNQRNTANAMYSFMNWTNKTGWVCVELSNNLSLL